MIKLLQGDCLMLLEDIPKNSIDMILIDPPYGTLSKKNCSWDYVIDPEKLWIEFRRIITDKGAIVVFGQEPFSSLMRQSALDMYRYDWIWKKQKPSNFQLMNFQCGRVHENIMVFSKAKACYTSNGNSMQYFPIKEKREKIRKGNVKIYSSPDDIILNQYKKIYSDQYKEYDDKHPTSILSFNTVKHRIHNAQKPVELLEYLIKTYTKEGQMVLDCCMGSGSTGEACINTDRNFIGIEKDCSIFEKATIRIENRLKEVAKELVNE